MITVRRIQSKTHLDHLQGLAAPAGEYGWTSFLQTPAWATVKSEWGSESLGWFDDGDLVGVGLVLYRQLPKLKRYLAYLPEGPVLDWSREDIADFLDPMVKHLKDQGAFGIRIGPPVIEHAWTADSIKDAIADENIHRLSDADPDETGRAGARVHNLLRHRGWIPPRPEGPDGFAAGQPKFNFWVPLAQPDGTPKSPDEVLKGMNQLWRRNIKKAAKAGVEVTLGGRDDLAEFHELYLHTAERDGFTGRPLAYFEQMWDALNAEDPDRMRLYLARHEGDLVASTTMVRVGHHAWYSYGASSTEKREVRGSNAIQWQMMQDALAAGCQVYDMRGITEGLEADDPHIGLIQFKVGTGGRAVEYLGEWDLPINRPLYAAFDAYMNRAAIKGRATRALGKVRSVVRR